MMMKASLFVPENITVNFQEEAVSDEKSWLLLINVG